MTRLVTKKTPAERGRTLPLAPDELAWWSESARKALGRGKQKALAEHTGMSESAISRLLNGETPNIDLLIVVSDYLGIAPPVFICHSAREAAELARQRELVIHEEGVRALVRAALANVKKLPKARKAG